MITITLKNKRQAMRLKELLERGIAYDDMYLHRNITNTDDKLRKYIINQMKL